jgi:hypothetical protein
MGPSRMMSAKPSTPGVLVDSRGKAWPDDSSELAQRYGYGPPEAAFVPYSIRERGCIHLVRQADSVRITLRAGKFSQRTLLGALLALETWPARILLSVYDSEAWSHEMFMSIGTFAEYAEDLAADRPYGTRQPWLATELGFEALLQPKLSTLGPLLSLWEQNRGRLPEDFGRAVAPIGLERRAILLRQVSKTERLVHEIVPIGLPFMSPCQWLHLIGRGVDELPDRQYGAWAAQAYLEVLAKGQPRLDSVRATIRTLEGATLRTRYYRLSIPWRGAGSDSFVSIVSVRRELSISPRDTARSMSESRASRR